MVGAVGDDTYGKDAIKVLTRNSIDTSCIWRAKSETTGTAVILVDEETGENRIVLNPGANRVWSFGQCCLPSSVDVAIFQLEIPLQAVSSKIFKAIGGETSLTKVVPCAGNVVISTILVKLTNPSPGLRKSEKCSGSGRRKP